MHRDDSWIRDEAAPEWVTLASGVRIRRMVEGNGCSIILYRLDRGRRFEQHQHPFAEFMVVLAGSGRALIGPENRALQEGDSVFVPGGSPHGFEVDPNVDVILMNVTVPSLPDLADPTTAEVVRLAMQSARAEPKRLARSRGAAEST